MKGAPLGPGGEDITWPHQVAPRGQKASSTRNLKPQTSNLKPREPGRAIALQRPNPTDRQYTKKAGPRKPFPSIRKWRMNTQPGLNGSGE